jgi:hypothetical protein
MATESPLSEELLAEIQAIATSERKSAEEVVQDALRAYRDEQGWRRLVLSGSKRAQGLGLKESDVNRLIQESRQETARRND